MAPRKRKTAPAETTLVLGDDPTTEKVELVKEVTVTNGPEFSALVQIISQKPADVTPEEEAKAEEDAVYFKEGDLENRLGVFKGIGLSMFDYAVSAGQEEAVRLLQKILGIPKTEVIDPLTVATWASAPSKRELIDDYNNMRKDSYKDLSAVRQKSKDLLSF